MQVIKGRQKRPFRSIIYGPPGAGKTSLAATADNALFINLEDALHHLDVHSTPLIISALDLLEASRFAIMSDYKTIVYDGIDALEDLLVNDICQTQNVSYISDISWGGGYAMLSAEWMKVIDWINHMVAKGKNVIMTGHSVIQTFKNPSGEDYDRYHINMNKSARESLCSHFDDIFFMNWEHVVDVTDQRAAKGKAVGNGDRVLYAQHRPSYIAKNRHNLPPMITITENETDFFKKIASN